MPKGTGLYMSDVTYTSRELLTWLWRDYLKKHMWVLLVAVIFMSIEASTMGTPLRPS